jgi:recombinational DNA repair ATPase RecF
MEDARPREVAAAMTLAGPHRDDVRVAQRRGDDLVDLRRMGSQGE